MVENVAVKVEEQEAARDPLRELNQELALADHYTYKNRKLLEALPSFKKDKADSLAEDYHKAVAEINRKARENTRDETYFMTDFSREVQEFNEIILNFKTTLKVLRKQVEAKE